MEELTTTPVGRPCASCTHPQRSELETRLLSGDPVSTISSKFSISISSLRRHRDAHLIAAPGQLVDAGLEPVAIVVRLAAVAERLREAAEAAEQAGDAAALVRASDGERRALQSLLSVGVTHESIPAELEFGSALRAAVGRLLRRAPELASQLARELEQLDRPIEAGELRALIHETTKGLSP